MFLNSKSSITGWRTAFAYLPLRVDGEWVWLRKYQRKYIQATRTTLRRLMGAEIVLSNGTRVRFPTGDLSVEIHGGGGGGGYLEPRKT